MVNVLAVAIGGATGATLRYLAGELIGARGRGGFPLATLTVNVLGAFLLGILMALLAGRGESAEWWRLLLGVGVLGGFTTFSTFAFETVELMHEGALALALANAAGSVVAGLLATVAGIYVGRML